MLRGLAWIAKLAAAGLILSFLSIWTTGYIVTSYVESVLKQYELPVEVPPMAMSGVWGRLWGSDPLVADKATAGEEDGDTNSAGSGSTAVEPDAEEAFGSVEDPPLTDVGVGKGSGAAGGLEVPGSGSYADGAAGEETGTSGEEDIAGLEGGPVGDDGDAGAENGQTGTESSVAGADGGSGLDGVGGTMEGMGGADGIEGTETALTTDELAETKNNMSDEDKDQLFELLMAKLPQEALQTISAYMEEGLTERELTNIQQIMAQHLDKEEYESMMGILKKY